MKINALVPELSVKDLTVSKRFYLDILGFVLEYERVENDFAFLSYGQAQIMIQQVNGYWDTGDLEYPFGRGINFQIASDDLEAMAKRLVLNSYPLFRGIDEFDYRENEIIHKGKEFLVQDPDGYLLRFSQRIQ